MMQEQVTEGEILALAANPPITTAQARMILNGNSAERLQDLSDGLRRLSRPELVGLADVLAEAAATKRDHGRKARITIWRG